MTGEPGTMTHVTAGCEAVGTSGLLTDFSEQRPVAVPTQDGRVLISFDEFQFIVDKNLANRLARNIDAALVSMGG